MYPLGNYDSSNDETTLDYFTWLRTVSHHSSPLQFLLRVTDDARTPPEELVNYASAVSTLRSDF
jgi:hypothetical protein